MTAPPFDRVVLAPGSGRLPFTRELLGRLPTGFPVDEQAPGDGAPRGRRILYVTLEPGEFLKPCPCSPGMVRCGYWVLSPAFQCPFSCTYCFLRFYAPDHPLTVYANLERAEAQFHSQAARWEGWVRLGTGEFADSLALDPWTGHSAWLRRLVAPHPRVILELKTKSTRIEALLEGPPLPNLVVAWSVNPDEWVAAEEAGTASLEARLAAAARVAAAGYRVAFHFDPVVVEEGWEEAYAEVARRLFEAVPPSRVAWVSLGTLRFPPRFLERWGRALKGRAAFFKEFVPCEDGKLRYFWPVRLEAYRTLSGVLRRFGGEALRLYLCMESKAAWARGLGWGPEEGQVERWLCGGYDCERAVTGAGPSR